MRLLCIIVIGAGLLSCNQNKPLVFKTKDFVLIDSTPPGNKFLAFDRRSASYPIYYIGSKKDTINIASVPFGMSMYYSYDFNEHQSGTYSSKTLKIIVDTAVATNSQVRYYSRTKKTYIQDSTVNYKSFLLSIENISDSVIYMGMTNSLFYVFREAQNKKGPVGKN